MNRLMRRIFLALALVACGALEAQVPPGYPSSYAETVAAAREEGRLVVHSTTDLSAAAPLVHAFEAAYPGIKVEYVEMDSAVLNRRFSVESASNASSADVLWSSAMDLQFKLVNDGFAQAYRSVEASTLPEWANWRNEAYGTTFEPVVFVYNERQLQGDEIPQTHADFARLLRDKPERFKARVTTYDIQKSAVGFLLATQDSRASPAFWALVKRLGASNVRLEGNTAAMMEAIGTGRVLLGYNVIGSYAIARAAMDPSIAVVLPKDYTLVLSRVMFIARSARHPNAAKLWVDFLLSQRGQTLLATKAGLPSVRQDVAGEYTAAAMSKTLGASLRPIGVGPGLLVFLDRAKQEEFRKQWNDATAGAK
ncbi:MAG TPA: ABC transporter substrate-binding protein [Burkholderiaceae bacterium]|nr:ABC transporter substrate-binding protein [Burkholderiaceae bacterium]